MKKPIKNSKSGKIILAVLLGITAVAVVVIISMMTKASALVSRAESIAIKEDTGWGVAYDKAIEKLAAYKK